MEFFYLKCLKTYDMRQRVIDNRPEINTEITVDCPVTRKILAIILFICNVFMAINLWQIYQKTASTKPLALLVFFTVIIIRGGIWYIRPVPRQFNSDMVIILYGFTLFTTFAMIKWGAFLYLSIDIKKLPVIYEKWNAIFDIAGFAIAAAAASLPDIIKQRTRQKP